LITITTFEQAEQPWFALQVRCRHEKAVAEILRSKEYEAFAPRVLKREQVCHTVQETDAPLFPGYVFAKFNPRFRLPLLMTPGVRGVVSYGRIPAPLSKAEISAIKTVVECRLPLEPCPYLMEGDRVRIVSGPLTGLVGVLIQMRSSYRVVLSVSLIRQSVRVEVDRDMLRLDSDESREPWCGFAS
jgi:transcription antitermination factor NusG